MVSELSSPELVEATPGEAQTQTPSLDSTDEAPPRWRRFDLTTQAEEGLQAAEDALAQGHLVVLPTDTVYGIAADAMQADGVQRLLDAKRRSRDMPPPVLIAEPAMLRALVAEVSAEIDMLINRFWPGALTLIMKAQRSLRMDLGRTEGTIAVRVPDNQAARALLRRTGPLAVSSANISGEPPATSVDEAIAQLGDSVAVYLDGGATPGPAASTIIDLASTPQGRIVRAGVIGHAELAEVLTELADVAVDVPKTAGPPEAGDPGEAMPLESADQTGSAGSASAAEAAAQATEASVAPALDQSVQPAEELDIPADQAPPDA